MSDEKKALRRNQRGSRVSTVVSISLVVFLLGTLAVLLLHAQQLGRYVRENMELSVMIRPEADSSQASGLLQQVRSRPYVKNADLVTKEIAAEKLKQELGDDFVSFLGFNPLYSSIDVHFKGDQADEERVNDFVALMKRHPAVQEVHYQPSLIESVNRNLRMISGVLLTFSALLILVSIALINSSIRISLYARRLLIKSMLLVGATKGFIRKPFLLKSIWNGLAGGIIAAGLLIGSLQLVMVRIPELGLISDPALVGSVIGLMLTTAVVLSFFCTLFAVNSYLRYRTENLY
jgi:cell division transport system permease protein